MIIEVVQALEQLLVVCGVHSYGVVGQGGD